MSEPSGVTPANRPSRPSAFAALLLVAFIAQCLLAIVRTSAGSQPTGAAAARSLILVIGLLLAASLWYVGRRVYGTSGALFALALYCFSPRMVEQATSSARMTLATWGYFGAIFTAIATAHTLYALPGVLSAGQRFRRPVMMGLALGVGAWALPAVALAGLLALAFLLYLAPKRRLHALGLWLMGCAAGALSFAAAAWAETLVPAPAGHVALRGALDVRQLNPVLLAMAAIALGAWLFWRRARFFANTAALIALAAYGGLLLVILSDQQLWMLMSPPSSIWNPALPMLFMFIGGVFADLLETRWRAQVLAAAALLLGAYAAIGLLH